MRNWISVCVLLLGMKAAAGCSDDEASSGNLGSDAGGGGGIGARDGGGAGGAGGGIADGGGGASGSKSWMPLTCDRPFVADPRAPTQCHICYKASCCDVLNACAAALGAYANDAGCFVRFDCIEAHLQGNLGTDWLNERSPDLVVEALRACGGAIESAPSVPVDIWTAAESIVVEAFECILSAPAITRTDDDAGWEIANDADDAGGIETCFEQCSAGG